MHYKILVDLNYTWEIIQGSFIKKFFDDFGTTTCFSVSGMVTKFTFIGIILKDTIALHGKNNLQPQTDNHKLEDTTAFMRKNNFIVCTPSLSTGWGVEPPTKFSKWGEGLMGWLF